MPYSASRLSSRRRDRQFLGEVGEGGESGASRSGVSDDRRMAVIDDDLVPGACSLREKGWRLRHSRKLASEYSEIATSTLRAPDMGATPIDGSDLVADLGSYHTYARRVHELETRASKLALISNSIQATFLQLRPS